MKKKTFGHRGFMGNRREELSRGTRPQRTADQERVQQEQKDDTPWQRIGQTPVPCLPKRELWLSLISPRQSNMGPLVQANSFTGAVIMTDKGFYDYDLWVKLDTVIDLYDNHVMNTGIAR
jgi:hypothetical protein